MASVDVLFVDEDLDFPPDEAVGDASAAVDICAFHDDGVLDLSVRLAAPPKRILLSEVTLLKDCVVHTEDPPFRIESSPFEP